AAGGSEKDKAQHQEGGVDCEAGGWTELDRSGGLTFHWRVCLSLGWSRRRPAQAAEERGPARNDGSAPGHPQNAGSLAAFQYRCSPRPRKPLAHPRGGARWSARPRERREVRVWPARIRGLRAPSSAADSNREG